MQRVCTSAVTLMPLSHPALPALPCSPCPALLVACIRKLLVVCAWCLVAAAQSSLTDMLHTWERHIARCELTSEKTAGKAQLQIRGVIVLQS